MNIKNISMYLIEKVSKSSIDCSVDYAIDKDGETLYFWHRDERYQFKVEGLSIYKGQTEEHQHKRLERIEKVIESNGEVLLND